MGKNFDPFALNEFARYYGFHYDRIDPQGLMEDVLYDMERGLRGDSSSLPMIPAYLSPSCKITPGKTVVALDAGGTNLRSALIRFDENGKTVESESLKAPMPGTQGQLGADAFFDEIAAVTAPLIEKAEGKVDGIGFCFSYAMKITAEADGILLAFSKEVDAPAVIGKAIGAGLREALIRRNIKPPERIVLLNDTVATLLSGLSQMPADGGLRRGNDLYGVEAGPVIGFILGTGINTAYGEKCIPKIGFNSACNPQIVVCESGNFLHRYIGVLDKEYDLATKVPGAYALEKAASGAYLGPLTFHIASRAIKDGLISFDRQEEFLAWPTMQTKDLNPFMHEPLARSGPIGELFGKDELGSLTNFVYLTSIITERAALLSAAVVAASVEKAGEGFDPFVPIRIAVEGTTFVVYKGMRNALEAHLHLLLNGARKRFFAIAPVEQASLYGAAVAALSSGFK
jgi:hexokinase